MMAFLAFGFAGRTSMCSKCVGIELYSMRILVVRSLGFSLFLLFIGISPVTYADQYDKQYRAVFSEYFLSQHYAVPLFDNGNIGKGDVVKYPEETPIKKGINCFNLGKVNFRNISALSIQLANALSIGVAAGIPVNKLANVEAKLGGRLATIHQISIDSASRINSEREPAEVHLKNIDDCELVRLVVQGRESLYILASDVIRGKVTAESAINSSANAKLDAQLSQEIQKVLGKTPRISIDARGNAKYLHTSRSPDVGSIAVKSRFVSPLHLASVYQLYSAPGARQLEQRVRELLTDGDVSIFEKKRGELLDYLERIGLREKDKSLFYNRIMYRESREVLDEKTLAKIPKEHWQALGVTAAAHELAVWQIN